VEDNDSVLKLLAAALEARDYGVVRASTPSAALEYVEQGGTFDLLLTDIVMPEFTGTELVARLRQLMEREFPTIFMSGYPRSGFTLDEQSGFLQKPFELESLFALADGLVVTAA
jgi:CheY-like chemotaxis protein